MVSRLRVVALVVLGSSVVACSDDEGPCTHEVCDVRDINCVQRTSEVVACTLGVAAATPLVRYADVAAVLGEIEAERAENPPTMEELERQRDALRIEALFGLMPTDYEADQLSADQLANVAAYYDSEDRWITILSDNSLSSPVLSYALLVHELVRVVRTNGISEPALAHIASYQNSTHAMANRVGGCG